jgi:hypothetical protein
MAANAIDLEADFASHHIEGHARAAIERGENGYFRVPLISHIQGNLWTGGCIDGVHLPDDFAHVVSLYQREQYLIGPDTKRVEHQLYDCAEIPSGGTLYDIAGDVAANLPHAKTLVHCQAGLNRSGLIAGLALVLGGMTPADAIVLLREKRHPTVLCNRVFEQWLLAQDPRA